MLETILPGTIFGETTVSLSEARDLFPGRPSALTIDQWVSRGVNGARLEYEWSGRKRFTSHEAIRRFLLSQKRYRTPDAPPCAVPRMSEAEIERGKEEMFGRKKPGPKPR